MTILRVRLTSWVIIYLKDVIYYKIETIKIKMSLDRLYDELEAGTNLTEVFIALNKSYSDDSNIFIPD